MKNIDFKRLYNLLNWDIRTYKKDYTTMLIAPFCTMLVISLIVSGYLFSFGSDFNVNHIIATEITPFAILFVMCAMLGVAGRAFQHMMTNQDRISYLMLPASNMEKYIVRVVCRTIIMFGLLIAGIVAADLIFGLLVWIRTGEFVSTINLSQFFSNTLGTRTWGTTSCVVRAIVVVFIWSFFVLGSAFFRRRAVLMTFLCLVGGALAIAVIMGISIGYIAEWASARNITIEFHDGFENIFDIICNLIVLCWLFFNLWFSYRLFSRMQVINNRWINK